MLKIHLIPPTLESMALNTISLELWKQPDIVNEIKHLFDEKTVNFPKLWIERENWTKIRERVVEKISHLPLPDLLKQKMNEGIEITGLRLKVWLKKFISLLPPNILDYIHLVTLNSEGEVDREKTAASILKAIPNMDLYNRYCFACMNCLEDEVRSLWKEIPVKYKNILLGIEKGSLSWQDWSWNYVSDIVIYWSCWISQEFNFLYRRIESGRFGDDNNINDYFIWDSITQHNFTSFKYFWEKLSDEEKQKNSCKYAIRLTKLHVTVGLLELDFLLRDLVGDLIDICRYLGSQMDKVQLKEMAQQDPYRAMQFWFWCQYWHEEFISLDSLWDFISPGDYRLFLYNFIHRLLLYPRKYEFFVRKDRRIFRELWENTPNNIKRWCFENVERIEFLLNYFIITADVENRQLIFDDATVEERNRIINHSFNRENLVSILEEYCFIIEQLKIT